ncbi:thiol reductant ABC exporter subunit CydC [Microbacterium sp. 18062]|uniref:thiol reductant ABC exporter subunit CydC n=1 Tax=Microbacterium sp. 18062 TaxID=2681410 RepID=UPI00135B23AD|nr:thiol reductant ABC exporter subunit CydC [Microbacterium sp. 18062]
MSASDVLRTAQPPLRRFWWALAAGLGTAISAIALFAASAWLITRSAEQPAVMYITAVVVAVRAFALGRGVFRYLERLTGHDAALGQLATVRASLVRGIVPLAPDGLGGTRRGALLSRLVDDVDELQNLPLRVVMPLGVAGLASVTSVVFVAFLSPAAAIALALCLAIAFALAVGVGWLAGARAERQVAPLRSRLADALVDELTSLDVLTAFGATDAAHARVRAADETLRRATVRRAGAQGLTSGAVSLLAGIASLATLFVAAPLLGEGGFTGPALAVVVLLPMAVFEVFGPVPLALASWRQVRTAADRIARTVPDETPVGIPHDEPAATGDAPALGTGISLRGVSARWPDRASGRSTDADVTVDADAAASVDDAGRLTDLDLHVAPGERVLVTGPSGAGKTTLAHVLVRFLDYAGSYRIGDAEARELSGDDLRRTIGLCEQSPYLFDESLRQNLLFARDTADDAQLWNALDRVGLAGWARERGGLDAALGERGALVSGGQAQRIALARALLADFPVLVLDEPTAGVDPAASDALLTDLLTAVDADRAVVLISHVEVPGGLVDREVRLESGRIV